MNFFLHLKPQTTLRTQVVEGVLGIEPRYSFLRYCHVIGRFGFWLSKSRRVASASARISFFSTALTFFFSTFFPPLSPDYGYVAII